MSKYVVSDFSRTTVIVSWIATFSRTVAGSS